MKKLLSALFCLTLVLGITLGLASCGKVEFKVDFVVDGEVYASVNTNGEETIKIPENPTKEGYTFDGWYWDKDTWQKPFTANSLLDAPLSSDMSVYAKWKDNKVIYAVTFEANGGTIVETIKKEVIEDSPVTTKDYNTFVGWYSDPSLQESTKITFPYTPTKDITLYAKWSVDFTEGLQLSLQVNTNTYAITGYTGTSAIVEIPSQYKGLEVTAINARAFEGNTIITSVIIPDSVISVGLGAFSECYNLESVQMSKQIQLVGASAFSNCLKLQQVDLPDTLINIGGEAFFGCTSLKELYLSNELTNIGTNIIRGCNSLEKLTMPGKITLISLVGDSPDNVPETLKEITIANGSESVCEKMLEGCVNIKNVTVTNSVTSIGDYAFYQCTAIEEIYFNATAMNHLSSSNYVFYNAGQNGNGIKVVIGANVTKIPDYLFYPYSSSYSPKIVSVEFEDGSVCTSIGDYAFYNCSGLTSVTIPDSVTSIGDYAFYQCTAIEEIYFNATAMNNLGAQNRVFYNAGKNGNGIKVVIGANVMKIPAYLFYPYSGSSSNSYSPKITSVEFEEGSVCTSIGGSAFYNCDSLTSMTIPDSVTSIGSYAFYDCDSLTSIVIPDSVTSIGSYAFYSCDSLKYNEYSNARYLGNSNNPYLILVKAETSSIIASAIHHNTRIVYSYAFYNCDSLTSVAIPDSVTSIGDYAFGLCGSLTSVTIGNSVTSIGSSAFSNCYSLTSVTIPDSVTSIGGSAFSYCSSLTSVTIGNGVTSISSSAFGDCSGLTSVTIPNSVTSIGNSAFSNCDSLTSVTIGNSVTSIDSYAFSGCTRLTRIIFEDTSTWYVTANYFDWLDMTGGTMKSVTIASTNAYYFRSNYLDYYWYKK